MLMNTNTKIIWLDVPQLAVPVLWVARNIGLGWTFEVSLVVLHKLIFSVQF